MVSRRLTWALGGLLLGGLVTAAVAAVQAGPTREEAARVVDRLNLEPALRAAEGVLGVRAMRWEDENREALFAWFEDREALLNWYLSSEHLDAVDAILTHSLGDSEPLAHLPEDSGPLLVIFYIAARPGTPPPEGLTLPLSAFSIEIYTPAAGGVTLVDGFAPARFKIPHHRRLLTDEGP